MGYDKQQGSDLFKDSQEANKDSLRDLLQSRNGLVFELTLEAATAIVITTIIALIIVFYLGVQRGKAVRTNEIRQKITQIKQKSSKVTKINKNITFIDALPGIAPTSKAKVIEKIAQTPYTIQVVTYRSEVRALKEVSNLQKKGYTAALINQGKLYVICVGRFENRTGANTVMQALKKRYPDCFLRKF
ncbi:MAG: cell division septation protein DedD [Candidatus Omnitrophota bacterium]|jgi:cell division septation protein DedD